LNIYLGDFDSNVSRQFEGYIRYADDFLIVCRADTKESKVRGFTEEQANRLGLKLKERKSQFVEMGSLEFLGYKFTLGENLQIGLSDFTKVRLKRKIRRLTNKRNFAEVNLGNFRKSRKLKDLIRRINYYFSTKKFTACKFTAVYLETIGYISSTWKIL